MPNFNLLAQAITDLVRYRSAARILTNKRNVVSIIRGRSDPPETVSGFRYPQQWGKKESMRNSNRPKRLQNLRVQRRIGRSHQARLPNDIFVALQGGE